MQETYQALIAALDGLEKARKEMREFGKDKARAQAEYKAYKASVVLKLRMEGTPVTIINDVAYEDEQLRNLMYLRDASETNYEAAREHVLILKKRVDVLRDQANQIARGE